MDEMMERTGKDFLKIKYRKTFNAGVSNEGSPLIIASATGDIELIKKLLSNNYNLNQVNSLGFDALMLASKNGQVKIVKLLLEHAADVNSMSDTGFNALILASENGHKKVVKELLRSDADVNGEHVNFNETGLQVQKNYNFTPLMIAAKNGHVNVVKLLVLSGAKVDRANKSGLNALMLACRNGHTEVVKSLLMHGAHVNDVNCDEISALMFSAQNGHTSIVKLLLRFGANLNRVNRSGLNALLLASEMGHFEVVKILVQSNADVKRINEIGCNALMLAAANGHVRVVKMLLRHSAEVNAINHSHFSALMLSSMNGHASVAKLLIKKGASVNQRNLTGFDSLMLACASGHCKATILLLGCGTDTNTVNADGWNALLYATKNSVQQTVECILEKNYHKKRVLPTEYDSNETSDALLHTEESLCYEIICLVEVSIIAFENNQSTIIAKCLELVQIKKELSVLTEDMQAAYDVCDFLQQLVETFIVKNEEKNCRPLAPNIERSIKCYLDVVCYIRSKQLPAIEVLLRNVQDILEEFSNMNEFKPFYFYMYQQSLHKIYCLIVENYFGKIKDFFSLLLKLQYIENTTTHLKTEDLLNSKAKRFTSTLIRDLLIIFLSGSYWSGEFTVELANSNFVESITAYLDSHKSVQNSQSLWITHYVIGILHNIAVKTGSKECFISNNTENELSTFPFHETIQPIAKKILSLLGPNVCLCEGPEEEELTLIQYVEEAVNRPEKHYKGYSLYEVIQRITKVAENSQSFKKVPTLIIHFKTTLVDSDPKLQSITINCLKVLSEKQQPSKDIVTDDHLTELLQKCKEREENVAIVNSIFWRAGRASGILPRTDLVVSDNFPQEFVIEAHSVGRGAFGSVHLVKDINRPDERKFVAKKYYLNTLTGMEISTNEPSILLKIKHNRIVEFYGYQRTKDAFYIFLEYLKNGTLALFISKRGILDEKSIRNFTIQILEGLNYLHQNNIIHRDIKGSNILMENEFKIKLTDFGISQCIDENGVPTEKGTVRYMAPEVIYTEGNRILNYTTRADIWSVGCTVIEMVTGKPPDSSIPTPRVLFKTVFEEPMTYKLPATSSVYLREFLDKVLKMKPKDRPTAESLLKNDPFINNNCIKIES